MQKIIPTYQYVWHFCNEIKTWGESDTKHPLANKKIFHVHLYSCVTKPSQFLKYKIFRYRNTVPVS